jgi:Thermostable hemolysin
MLLRALWCFHLGSFLGIRRGSVQIQPVSFRWTEVLDEWRRFACETEELYMQASADIALIDRKYREKLGAKITPNFQSWLHCGSGDARSAALGFRRASSEPLFLEVYLDRPIESFVSATLNRPVARNEIIEIGNFAAENAMAMIALWGAAANDLGGNAEVAVATLTAPLRRMFLRIGIPMEVMAPATPDRLGKASKNWGRYYSLDPQICVGVISEGQQAIANFISRRAGKAASL